MTAYITAVLWIAVISQLLVNRYLIDDDRIVDAFTKTQSVLVDSNLYLVADMGTDYLSEEDEKNIVQYMASEIGLNADCKVQTEDSSITVSKRSDQADTTIKLITTKDNEAKKENETWTPRRYLTLNITIYKEADDILTYKKRAEGIVSKLNAIKYESQITFTGIYEGQLTLQERNAITDNFLSNMQANIVSENRSEDLFTVYAYTGLIDDSIKASGKKVNMNVAITYDEMKNETKLYVATPILNGDY
jgi:hypothetical protein